MSHRCNRSHSPFFRALRHVLGARLTENRTNLRVQKTAESKEETSSCRHVRFAEFVCVLAFCTTSVARSGRGIRIGRGRRRIVDSSTNVGVGGKQTVTSGGKQTFVGRHCASTANRRTASAGWRHTIILTKVSEWKLFFKHESPLMGTQHRGRQGRCKSTNFCNNHTLSQSLAWPSTHRTHPTGSYNRQALQNKIEKR